MQGIIAQRENTIGKVPTSVPGELAHVLARSVESNNGCVLSRAFPAPAFEAVRDSVIDRTGYECFVNHFHFVQPKLTTGLSQAEEFCRRMIPLVRQAGSATDFRFIVSNDGDEWTVRFHAIRPGENWVSGDLESYVEEAVLVVDAAELLSIVG